MKSAELRDMSKPELNVKLEELSAKKFKLGFTHKTTMLKNPMELRNIRKDIAKLKTIIRQKESN